MAVNFYTVIGKHPSIGFKKASKITVNTTQFGEGYKQRTSSGINSKQQDIQVSFINQDLTTAQKIIDFLETAGTKDFGTGASASVTISGGNVTDINLITGGSKYYIPPVITIDGDGTGAKATALLTGTGQISSIAVTNGGTGYTTATVTITPAAGDATKAGVDYFLWTAPDESEEIKVTCEEWDIEYSSTISRTINAKFVRVYDL